MTCKTVSVDQGHTHQSKYRNILHSPMGRHNSSSQTHVQAQYDSAQCFIRFFSVKITNEFHYYYGNAKCQEQESTLLEGLFHRVSYSL